MNSYALGNRTPAGEDISNYTQQTRTSSFRTPTNVMGSNHPLAQAVEHRICFNDAKGSKPLRTDSQGPPSRGLSPQMGNLLFFLTQQWAGHQTYVVCQSDDHDLLPPKSPTSTPPMPWASLPHSFAEEFLHCSPITGCCINCLYFNTLSPSRTALAISLSSSLLGMVM